MRHIYSTTGDNKNLLTLTSSSTSSIIWPLWMVNGGKMEHMGTNVNSSSWSAVSIIDGGGGEGGASLLHVAESGIMGNNLNLIYCWGTTRATVEVGFHVFGALRVEGCLTSILFSTTKNKKLYLIIKRLLLGNRKWKKAHSC